MQIAMIAAGFSAGDADKVRRSMAAWKRKGGLEHFRDQLMSGMLERGYTPEFAEAIFKQVLGFGSYGFPMSHSASFALLTYASCWLKCHWPGAFCAALLNSQPLGFYAPAQLVNDARRNGVEFRKVDVCVSNWDCTLESDEESKPAVRLGLRMVKGLSEDEARRIESARGANAFRSVEDLTQRAMLNQRALNLLSRADALESLAGHRHDAHWSAAGVQRFDAVLRGREIAEQKIELPAPREGQTLIADYDSLGLSLGRHPLALLRRRLNRMRVVPAERLKDIASGRDIKVAGLVTHRQRPQTASGVVFATLEDETGTVNLVVWPKVFDQQREAFLGASLLVVKGELQSEQGVINLICHRFEDHSELLGSLQTNSRDFH